MLQVKILDVNRTEQKTRHSKTKKRHKQEEYIYIQIKAITFGANLPRASHQPCTLSFAL